MPSPIVRVYETEQAAQQAAQELRRHQFSADDVHVVHAGERAAELFHAAGLPRQRAAGYAEVLHGARAAVVVNPPFGNGALAEEIVDHFQPASTGGLSGVHGTEDYHDDATPFSRMLGWRVLLHNPEPFSSWLGWSTLSKKKFTLGDVSLSQNPAPLSRALGMATLSHTAAPLSKATGMKQLSNQAAPFSSMLGLRTLSAKPFALGDVKLSHDAAPFSKMLGLPTLTKNQ